MDTTEQRIKALEERIKAVEADRDRFLAALIGAAEMAMKNPVVSTMIPKHVREDLKTYIAKNKLTAVV